ncbi:trafficking protein particle complex subunit 14 [Platichthys flesus]|uniref:trafficking protein particle complex subunit 14 n=1 Tax=Platichthys flesus TaxID=8260 RepID=UPI002DBD28A1|nr:trafficking protein particle complex subunit 14 [Platichthys flesus]
MEPLCEYFMYFPAAPISSLLDPAEYATLPRRNHVYLGETVQFLLVLRFREDRSSGLPWKDQLGSLSAVASVCVAESRQQRHGEGQPDLQSSCSEDDEEKDPSERESGCTDSNRTFRACNTFLIHKNPASDGRLDGKETVKSALVLDDQVIFCLTVSLGKLPVNTLKAKIMVTVWKQEEENVEVREHGYMTLLQLRSPTHTFRQDLSTFKAQVNTTLNVLPPPSVQCQQLTVSGKHVTVLKVVNCSSQEEMCVRDMKILPNYNLSYLPMMPDGSVLIVDNACHQSAEVTMASFYRIDSESSRLPSTLSALEQQNFLFQLQLQNKPEEDSSEGSNVDMLHVICWCWSTVPLSKYISSYYSFPSIRLDRPQLVMTASCPRAVRPSEHFWVKYTLLNNLQDFAVHLIWNSEELSQHMKLKLQLTATVSTHPPRSPLKKSPLSSSLVAGELLETRTLGRSQSFSHQQSARSNHVRTGSVMEHRAITPLMGPSMGKASQLPPDQTLISLDKIAKRKCKVLVLEHVQEAYCR